MEVKYCGLDLPRVRKRGCEKTVTKLESKLYLYEITLKGMNKEIIMVFQVS